MVLGGWWGKWFIKSLLMILSGPCCARCDNVSIYYKNYKCFIISLFLFIICLMIIFPIIKLRLGTVCWLSTTTNLRYEIKIFRREKDFNGWRSYRNEKWKLSLGKILFIFILQLFFLRFNSVLCNPIVYIWSFQFHFLFVSSIYLWWPGWALFIFIRLDCLFIG